MNWVLNHSPIFFDFDGLLVNTEHLHYQAYQLMLKKRACHLPWDLITFLFIAHKNATGLKESILSLFPALKTTPWDILYKEKKALYLELVISGALEMMPGAEEMINRVQMEKVPCAVVTNSTKQEIMAIKKHLPCLRKIPTWVVREDYSAPKPAPDAYLKALQVLGETETNSLGFEDSLRGVHALVAAKITPVLICSENHPQMGAVDKEQIKHVTSFKALL